MQNLEGKKDEAPDDEGNTEEPIGESFMMLAFAPKEEAHVNVDEGGGYVGRKGQEVQRVGGGPDREDHAGDDGGNNPELVASIELRAEEEADPCKPEESVIQGGQQRVFTDPGRETRAEIVQAVEDPGRGPIEKIRLALEGIDVGEEYSDEESSDQETERNDALNHRQAQRRHLLCEGSKGERTQQRISGLPRGDTRNALLPEITPLLAVTKEPNHTQNESLAIMRQA